MLNRKFLDISAVVKVDDDGLLDYSRRENILNKTDIGFNQHQKLGRIKMLRTPSSHYNSGIGTTDFTIRNLGISSWVIHNCDGFGVKKHLLMI